MRRSHSSRARSARTLFVVLVSSLPELARAQGGPPFITDDPDTPGKNHWEINIAANTTYEFDERTLEAPRLDVNYGPSERVQLKIEAAWTIVDERDRPNRSGAGPPTFGLKWRFVDETRRRPAISVYPQWTPHVRHGPFADEPREIFLPLEVRKRFGRGALAFETGYDFLQGSADIWEAGLLSSYTLVPDRFEIAGELHGKLPNEWIADAGLRNRFGKIVSVFFSAGRGVLASAHTTPRLVASLGLQLSM